MNNKDTIDTVLKAYLDGDRSDKVAKAIFEWTEKSPKNACMLIELEQILASECVKAKTSPENVEEAYRKLNRKIRFYNRFFRYAIGMAAAVVVGFAGFLFWNKNINETMLVARSGNEVKVINLSDGSKVWLNKNSELHYPKIFKGGIRKVGLIGEAYFEVGANKDFPFIVSSNGLKVTAVGTAFNFNTRISNEIEEVALLEGSVYVQGNKNEGEIMIVPYQKVILDKKAKMMRKEQIRSGIEAYWHNRFAPLNNVTINDIAGIFENIYGVKIKVIGGNNYQSTYSGFISQNETIEEALKALSYSIPFIYSINGSNVTITMKNNFSDNKLILE